MQNRHWRMVGMLALILLPMLGCALALADSPEARARAVLVLAAPTQAPAKKQPASPAPRAPEHPMLSLIHI